MQHLPSGKLVSNLQSRAGGSHRLDLMSGINEDEDKRYILGVIVACVRIDRHVCTVG